MASRLANPKIGWGFGWLTFCYLVIGVVAVDNALASTAFMPLAGLEPNESVARMITVVALLIQAVLAIASTRIIGWINSSAVGLELVLVVVLLIALGIAVGITSNGSVDNLISRGIAQNAPNYFGDGLRVGKAHDDPVPYRPQRRHGGDPPGDGLGHRTAMPNRLRTEVDKVPGTDTLRGGEQQGRAFHQHTHPERDRHHLTADPGRVARHGQ